MNELEICIRREFSSRSTYRRTSHLMGERQRRNNIAIENRVRNQELSCRAGAPCTGWVLKRIATVPPFLFLSLLFDGYRFASGAVDQNGVTFEGVYNYQNLHPVVSGNIELSKTGYFQVTIHGARWIISYESISARTNPSAMYSRVDASCDSTNVYVVQTMSPALIAQGVGKLQAKFYSGAVPPPVEREPYNLWVAFISSLVWSNATGAAKPPNTPDLSLFYNTNFFCRYFWTTVPQDDCVRKLVLKSEGRILTRDLRNNGGLRYVSLGAPYTNGYVMGVGCWLEATNVLGVWAPIRYEFSFFAPKENARSDADLTKVYRCQSVVTNVYTAAKQLTIPFGLPESGFVFVTDHRFADQGRATVTYGLTNKWSAATAERIKEMAMRARKQSLEEQALEQHGFKLPRPIVGPNRLVVRLIIAVAIVLPPLLMIGKRLLVNQRTKQTEKP